jgi:hypothetical protein
VYRKAEEIIEKEKKMTKMKILSVFCCIIDPVTMHKSINSYLFLISYNLLKSSYNFCEPTNIILFFPSAQNSKLKE